jgi:spore coat protein U-like protein
MTTYWPLRLLLATTAVAIVAAPAMAGTDSDVLTLKVVVQQSCLVLSSPIDFGTYIAGQQAALDAEGTISYAGCAVGTLTISLDGGTAGSIVNRQMSNGDAKLNYQLYRNSARNEVWGSEGDALQRVLLAPEAGSIPVYGRIAGGQNVAGGTYVDTINVTLTF